MSAFTHLQQIIQSRRTVKPPLMNGGKIPEAQLQDILELANWAPTHGLTEPWRFIVYGGDQVQVFCRQHADLYQENIPAEKFMAEKYDKLRDMGNQASHLVVAVMQRGTLPGIPVLEEIAAASCAVQNMLLGATALGIASYWGSGGMAYHPAMKKLLRLAAEDLVLGILYLGYTDKQLTGRRNSPIKSKITRIG
jgi:nitroreductase